MSAPADTARLALSISAGDIEAGRDEGGIGVGDVRHSHGRSTGSFGGSEEGMGESIAGADEIAGAGGSDPGFAEMAPNEGDDADDDDCCLREGSVNSEAISGEAHQSEAFAELQAGFATDQEDGVTGAGEEIEEGRDERASKRLSNASARRLSRGINFSSAARENLRSARDQVAVVMENLRVELGVSKEELELKKHVNPRGKF